MPKTLQLQLKKNVEINIKERNKMDKKVKNMKWKSEQRKMIEIISI